MPGQTVKKRIHPEDRSPWRPTRAVSLALVIGVGLLAGWVLWLPENSQENSSRPKSQEPGTVSPQGATLRSPRETVTLTENSWDFTFREGREAEIRLADAPADRALVLNLELAGEENSDFGIKSAWIYQEDREPLELRAERSGGKRFRAELPAASLAPGRAIIELRTDENSPLALRRFAVQIR